MADLFARCLPLILKHEGGYVDHPADPGGATNLGVTIGTLSGWLGRPASKAEVRALTIPNVAPIYRRNYWDAVKCDQLPAGVDYCAFDLAVNSGPRRAITILQRAVNVEEGGRIGPVTLAALKAHQPDVIVRRMCDDRLDFLRRLPTWPTFGKGWTNRVVGVEREALKLVGVVVPIPPKRPPVRPGAGTGAGGIIIGVLGLFAWFKEELFPYVLFVAVIGGGVGGFIYVKRNRGRFHQGILLRLENSTGVRRSGWRLLARLV